MMAYGTYAPETVRHVFRCTIPRIVLPLSCAGGGMADATYSYEGRSPDADGHHRYRLTGVHEWLPPLHPSLMHRADRQHCARPDGTTDLEAEATLRRREWAQFKLMDGPPIYEDADGD